jgi:hypothetical protein
MKAFFAGFAAGLIILSIAGSHVVSAEWSNNFTRFNRAIHPETNYFPTVRQMMQIVDAGDQGKITVIIGGTSVFYGVGQQEPEVWTRRLQDRLGERFRVINFAQRAGRANDFGNIAAEILLRRKQPVIYVADGMPVQFSIDYDSSFYQKEIVEAETRGHLIPWEARDRLLAFHISSKPNRLQSAILGSIADRWLNFTDLWNYVVYRYANLNWTALLPFDPIQPRSARHPDEPSEEAISATRYQGPADAELAICRSWILADTNPRWPSIIGLTESTIPPQLRWNTVAAINLRSPHYLKLLTAQEQEGFLQTARKHAAELARMDFARTLISGNGYADEDYVDGLHLSASGGHKLADIVAPNVISLAQQLGYIK